MPSTELSIHEDFGRTFITNLGKPILDLTNVEAMQLAYALMSVSRSRNGRALIVNGQRVKTIQDLTIARHSVNNPHTR